MTPFSLGCALYCRKYKYKRLKYRHFKITQCEFTAPVLNSLLEKGYHFVALLKLYLLILVSLKLELAIGSYQP